MVPRHARSLKKKEGVFFMEIKSGIGYYLEKQSIARFKGMLRSEVFTAGLPRDEIMKTEEEMKKTLRILNNKIDQLLYGEEAIERFLEARGRGTYLSYYDNRTTPPPDLIIPEKVGHDGSFWSNGTFWGLNKHG